MTTATPPDAGALDIRRMLTERDPVLERAARQLAKALPRGLWTQTDPRLRLAVDPALVEALRQLRDAYGDLWQRIDSIDTSRHVAKRHALEAVDLLNASLTLLLRSTQATSFASGVRAVQEAKERQARGSSLLHQAWGELA